MWRKEGSRGNSQWSCKSKEDTKRGGTNRGGYADFVRQVRGIKVIQWQEDKCNKYKVWAACDVGWWHWAAWYGCHSVIHWVCKCGPWMCDLGMNCGGFFPPWMKTTMTRRLSVLGGEVQGAGEGWDENRIILTLPFPDIHNALKDTVSIQRPPPLSFYDKLRHSTIWWGPGTITPVIISQNPFHLTSAVDAHYSR